MSRRVWVPLLGVAALVTVGATGFLSASATSSGGPGGFGGLGGHWGHEHGDRLGFELFLRKLNLTDAQRGQIQTIMSQERESAGSLHKQLHGEKAALSSKFFTPGALQAADLDPDVQKLAGIQQQLLEQRIQTAVAIRNVLTAPQLAQAAQLKTQIDALHEQMRSLLGPSHTPE